MATPAEAALDPAPLEPAPGGIRPFRNAHLWLLIPLVITVLGFARGYFLNLRDASWLWHLHGISATLWFVLLIVQPYLATHGRLAVHRVLGPIGILLAGMVAASALAVIPGNIEGANDPSRSPIVPPTFLYGVSVFDLVMVAAFVGAVLMAMLRVRSPREHALWMLSTAFLVLSPGLGRLVAFTTFAAVGVGDRTLTDFIAFAAFPILAAIAFVMFRIRQAHPALVLAFVVNAFAFLVPWFGDNETWRAIADALLL